MGLNVSRGCARKSLEITRSTDINSSIIYAVLSDNQFTADEALYPLLCASDFKQPWPGHAGKMKIHRSDFLKWIRMAFTRHYCVGAAPALPKMVEISKSQFSFFDMR